MIAYTEVKKANGKLLREGEREREREREKERERKFDEILYEIASWFE